VAAEAAIVGGQWDSADDVVAAVAVDTAAGMPVDEGVWLVSAAPAASADWAARQVVADSGPA
jgi:hypothetical protein